MMPPAWPDDSYLLLLGKVVYSIASLEGLLVFDLPRMPDTVDGLTPDALAGKTTTGIGKLLQNRAPGYPTSFGGAIWHVVESR
jgi:hypothetical protein